MASPVECKKLSYTINSLNHLNKWAEPLKKDQPKLTKFRTSFSSNAANFIYDSKPPVVKIDVHDKETFSTTNPNNFGNVSVVLRIEEGNLAKKRSILSLIFSKFEEKKQIFVEIECLEYGVSSQVANDRINLTHQMLEDVCTFHNDAQKLTIKRRQNVWERIPSFHELFWLVIMSILEEGPVDFREIRVDKPVLLSALLLSEILNDCNGNTKITVCYSPIAVGWEENFSGNSVPMIIFSNADIDAALDASVNAAWFSEGLVPWATTAILVQESIYPKFISSLKNRLQKSVENGTVLRRNLNVEDHTQKNVENVLSVAKEHNLEIFQVSSAKEKCAPATLVIGDFVKCCTKYTERTTNKTLPVLFVVPFRTITEALSTANSSPDKTAVSVWSESFNTCSSCISQLNFGTIWINSYAIFDSLVPFFNQSGGCEPVRPTGIDYYHWNKSLLSWLCPAGADHDSLEDGKPFSEAEWQNLLSSAHGAHRSWGRKDLHDRIKILDDVWKHIPASNSSLYVSLKKQLVDTICGKVPSSSSFQAKDCLVSSLVESVGIIIFKIASSQSGQEQDPKTRKYHLLKHILSAVFSKNVVIVSGDMSDFSALKPCLPENVLTVTGKVPLDKLGGIVQKHKLRGNISIWKLDDDIAKYYTLQSGGSNRAYTFDMDLDIRPHVVRRKVVWMPLN